MTVFEYVMVMVSIILALALAQLLRGLTEITKNPNRYWVHSSWIGILAFLVLQFWWAYWDFSGLESWTFAVYVYLLLSPIALFVATYLLVPETRTTEMDWRKHFYQARRWFFLTLILLSILGAFGTWIFLGVALLHPYRGFQALLLTIIVVGMFSRAHKIHATLVVLYLVILLLSQLLIRMSVGALART